MANRPLTDAEIRAQIPEARARALRAQLDEPHAATAAYDATTRRLVVGLTNGATFAVPVAHVPELQDADAAVLAGVEVGPAGVGLHWPALDADLSVAGLARVVFGAQAIARAAAARAGAARTEAKAEAARANGAKGGRPRRTPAVAPAPAAPATREHVVAFTAATAHPLQPEDVGGWADWRPPEAPAGRRPGASPTHGAKVKAPRKPTGKVGGKAGAKTAVAPRRDTATKRPKERGPKRGG